MSTNETEKDVVGEWRDSAPYWEKHADTVRSMFAPITRALIQASGIASGIVKGQTVLDVAGGAGEPAITISSVVGDTGSVIFTDAVARMVTTARSRALESNQTNIAFAQCLAESLPFTGDSFDAITTRLGLMLFPDPFAAIREALRVVKPGGSLTFAVWSTRDANPFFKVVADVVARYIESPPEVPNAPGAFRFAERGKLARAVADAGAFDVQERLLDFELDTPLTPREFWAMRVELSDTLRSKVAELTADQLLRVKQEVEQAAQPFFVSGRMNFPAQVLIVTGVKR